MHCKKLGAQKPTENPLKPINSKYILYKKSFKKHLFFLHLFTFLLFSLSFSVSLFLSLCLLLSLCICLCLSLPLTHRWTHTPVCILFIYPACIPLFLLYVILYICLTNLSMVVSWWLKDLPRQKIVYLLSLPEPCRLRHSDIRKCVKVSPTHVHAHFLHQFLYIWMRR